MARLAAVVLLLACMSAASAQTCLVCGEVRSVREVHNAPPPGALGAGTGSATSSAADTAPVVGSVASFSWGQGKGDGWRLGAAGTPEMQARLSETSYEITVAMDSGDRRTLTRRDGDRFRVGQRVALRGGELEPM